MIMTTGKWIHQGNKSNVEKLVTDRKTVPSLKCSKCKTHRTDFILKDVKVIKSLYLAVKIYKIIPQSTQSAKEIL